MIPVRAPNLPWREIDDCAVILSPRTGNVHELNEVGAFLWAHADGKLDFEALVELMAKTFEVTAEVARADADAFFSELTELGLLRRE